MTDSASTPAGSGGRWSAPMALVLATLVAGTLDLGYALVVSGMRGTAPPVLLQAIATGLLGKASFEGGAATAVLGAALHYGIMACIVVFYYLLSRRLPLLLQRPCLFGALYGAGVFFVMNYVVVPLSAIGHTFQRPPLLYAGEMFSHVVFVGISTAWILSRARQR
jgi:hypothetical protein